jgi:hypothetical protein
VGLPARLLGVIIRAAARSKSRGNFSGRLLKVTERRDDTTNEGTESRPARERGGYYYDDATGYETYTPEDEEKDEGGRMRDEGEPEQQPPHPSSAEEG